MNPEGSGIWTLGSQLVVQVGELRSLAKRGMVTWKHGLQVFIASPHFQFAVCLVLVTKHMIPQLLPSLPCHHRHSLWNWNPSIRSFFLVFYHSNGKATDTRGGNWIIPSRAEILGYLFLLQNSSSDKSECLSCKWCSLCLLVRLLLVAQVALKLEIFLSQSPKCWEYRHVPPYLAC